MPGSLKMWKIICGFCSPSELVTIFGTSNYNIEKGQFKAILKHLQPKLFNTEGFQENTACSGLIYKDRMVASILSSAENNLMKVFYVFFSSRRAMSLQHM